VNQGGGLKRLAGILLCQSSRRQLPQIVGYWMRFVNLLAADDVILDQDLGEVAAGFGHERLRESRQQTVEKRWRHRGSVAVESSRESQRVSPRNLKHGNQSRAFLGSRDSPRR
jgi:hypothetical protein